MGSIRKALRGFAVPCVLIAFYGLMVAVAAHKSATFDEPGFAAAGVGYWRWGDYRVACEDGNLPHRIMALPLLGFSAPSRDDAAWHDADEVQLGRTWLNGLGNPAPQMVLRGRMACAVVMVGCAVLVWWGALELFGASAAMGALLLWICTPLVLAHGPLMSADGCCTLFFSLTMLLWWRLCQRVTLGRILASALSAGALFVSKMSGPLIIPLVVILALVRIAEGSPLEIGRTARGRVSGRWRTAGCLLGLIAIHGAAIFFVIWASFGFRYAARPPNGSPADRLSVPWEALAGTPPLNSLLDGLDLTKSQAHSVLTLEAQHHFETTDWRWEIVDFLPELETKALTPGQALLLKSALASYPRSPVLRAAFVLRDQHVLPEGYLFGLLFIAHRNDHPRSFFNGRFGDSGRFWFFPYAFLVKTPFGQMGLFALAVFVFAFGAGAVRPWRRFLYLSAPWWLVIAAYGGSALAAQLNIGLRHLLPVYPALCVLTAVVWIWQARAARWLPGLLLVGAAAESIACFPNYLSYFNLIGGGRDGAYRHLADSSLDWGQDLPDTANYVRSHAEGKPYFIDYFGSTLPSIYGIEAKWRSPVTEAMLLIPKPASDAQILALARARPDYDLAAMVKDGNEDKLLLIQRPEEFSLQPGTYLISATNLQWGAWGPAYEAVYQDLRRQVAPLFRDSASRLAALKQLPLYSWSRLVDRFGRCRQYRFYSYLATQRPKATINGSILVYSVGQRELHEALEGPPPVNGVDELTVPSR